MEIKEFLEKRIPVYINPDTGLIEVVNSSSIKNEDFAKIFYNLKIYWLNTIRGYLLDDHIILYINDYEIPNIAAGALVYIFNYFPNIKWIGLGCNKGKPGEVWPPKLLIRKVNDDILSK